MSGAGLGVVIVLLLAALYALLRPGSPDQPATGGVHVAGVDEAELAEAERELDEDLAPDATPEDAEDDLEDWGPGAPKDV